MSKYFDVEVKNISININFIGKGEGNNKKMKIKIDDIEETSFSYGLDDSYETNMAILETSKSLKELPDDLLKSLLKHVRFSIRCRKLKSSWS